MLFTIIEILVVTIACCAASVHYIHALQMERYQTPAYRQWLAKNRDRILKDNVLWAFVAVLLRAYLPVLLSMFIKEEPVRNALSGWLVLALFTALMAWITWRDYTMPSRKPFVVTQRVRRLLTVLFLLSLAVTALMAMMRPISVSPYFLYALMPFMVLAAAAIIGPYEARLNATFFKSAKNKLRAHQGLITIGITGSYGKTNVKFILRDILSKQFKVLATPASFNTAMGISRVVNDQLKPEHQVFIAEMGATHVGDIKELVGLVRPKYGIITSIGPRHMDYPKAPFRIPQSPETLPRMLQTVLLCKLRYFFYIITCFFKVQPYSPLLCESRAGVKRGCGETAHSTAPQNLKGSLQSCLPPPVQTRE